MHSGAHKKLDCWSAAAEKSSPALHAARAVWSNIIPLLQKKKKNSLSRVPLPARRPPAVKTKSKHKRRIKRGTKDEKLCPAVEQSWSALFGLIAAPQHFGVPARRHRCHGSEIYDLPTLKQGGGAESRARHARREKIPSLNGASERLRSAHTLSCLFDLAHQLAMLMTTAEGHTSK